MLNLTDLGIEPETSAATETDATILPYKTSRKGLVPGSLLARTLFSAFSRQPVIIIDSPPGAGKTSLVVDMLEQLLRRSEFQIVLACPTRRGAYDVAERLVAALGTDSAAPAVVLSVNGMTAPEGAFKTRPKTRERHVTIRTVKSCTHTAPECDILIFDEAYQTTYSNLTSAADAADQVIMVGDPGQIGPVVTQDVSPWKAMKAAPHHRAPEVFARRSDAVVYQMDATYRLGQPTVDAISPLYGFPFTSRRPDRFLVDGSGNRVAELDSHLIAPSVSVDDMGPMKAVAALAVEMLDRTVVSYDEDGNETRTNLTEKDVAVVVSHNIQASGIKAILRSESHEGIAVGTADSMQGGQWHAVVSLDPLVGHDSVSPHQLNKGRLCVMASRHMTHLTWVGDGQEVSKLSAAVEDSPEAKSGIAVRRALMAGVGLGA